MNLTPQARRLRNLLRKPSEAPKKLRMEVQTLAARRFEGPSPSRNGYRRIYNIHVRKCAGTALNKSIIGAIGGDESFYDDLSRHPAHRLFARDLPVVGWNHAALNKEAFFYGFSHLPLHELELSEDTFTFTFLRDPVQRIVSHFRMLNDYAVSQPDHVALKLEHDWAGDSFDHFLKNIPREHLHNQLFMFSEGFRIDEALSKLDAVNHVGHVSGIQDKFIPMMAEEFGIAIGYRKANVSRHSFQITDAQREACILKARPEIDFYNAACDRFGLESG